MRGGDYTPQELRKLEDYRAEFDELLLATNARIVKVLRTSQISAVVAGRSKRVKYIIRKLRRPANHGMDLSRMADVVGLRVILGDLRRQDEAVEVLRAEFPGARVVDYRAPDKAYRAVHLTIRSETDFRLIEVQLRTLPQQLWANESESFGEEVKEGGGSQVVQAYLAELSAACRAIDEGLDVAGDSQRSPIFSARSPLVLRLPVLSRLFRAAVAEAADQVLGSYVVVYDNETNQCLQRFSYMLVERDEALRDYQRICRELDDARYEVLILNSGSEASIPVTHPRFFPEPIEEPRRRE